MKTLSVIFCTLLTGISFAQESMYANEGTSTFQSNPASFGNQETFSVNSFGQIQWTEYYGTPANFNVNTGGSIPLTKNKIHQLIVGGSYGYGQDYFTKEETMHLSLGYRVKWNEHIASAVAFGSGISDLRYNLFIPMVSGTGDELYFTRENHGKAVDFNIGTMHNWKTAYLGASITHLNRPKVGSAPVELAPTLNVQAGYKIPIMGHAVFPMLQYQSVNGFRRLQVITHYVFKNDLFSAGIGFRNGGNIIYGASVALKGIRLGYNYIDIRSRLSDAGSGMHELRLSYAVGKE